MSSQRNEENEAKAWELAQFTSKLVHAINTSDATQAPVAAEICGDLDALQRLAHKTASTQLKKLGSVRPQVHLLKRDGRAGVFLTPQMPGDRRDQTAMASCLGMTILACDIDACFMIAEIWIADYERGDRERSDYLQPKQRPDRREGVFCRSMLRDDSRSCNFEIKRDGRQRPSLLQAAHQWAPRGEGREEAWNPLMSNLFDVAEGLKDFRGVQDVMGL